MVVESGDRVLLITGPTSTAIDLPGLVNKLTEKTGAGGKVQVEHVDRLCTCKCMLATGGKLLCVNVPADWLLKQYFKASFI